MVFRFLFTSLSLSFLCSSVYEAQLALSFSFLSERFSSVRAKAALAYSPVGFYRPILTLSMCAFGPRNSAYAFLDTADFTYRRTEISIEHPSVGLASLAQSPSKKKILQTLKSNQSSHEPQGKGFRLYTLSNCRFNFLC